MQPVQPVQYYAPMQMPTNDRALEWVLPINRSGLAIAAGYLGLVTIPVVIAGPVAVLLGILALRDIKQHPEKRGKGRAWFGIVYGGLAAIVAVLYVVFVVVRASNR
jgi:hypothetical protein